MRVVLVGAGKVGSFIAAELLHSGHEVVFVEQSGERVDRLSDRPELLGATWVVADACEVSDLARAHPETADVFVAVTGDDEDNLVSSLLAKQEFAVPRVLARVNHPANEWLFDESWGIDTAVSTPHLLTALVEQAVSSGSLVRLFDFAGSARLVEVALQGHAPVLGQTIEQAGFPRGSSVVAIIRSGGVVVPRGDTMFHEGDEVLALVTDDSEPGVRRLLLGD